MEYGVIERSVDMTITILHEVEGEFTYEADAPSSARSFLATC